MYIVDITLYHQPIRISIMEKVNVSKKRPRHPVSERMAKIVTFYEDSVANFARKINRSGSSVNNTLARDEFSLELLNIITQMYPEVNDQWLKTGKGCPFKCGNEERISKNESTQNEIIKQQTAIINFLLKRFPGDVSELSQE